MMCGTGTACQHVIQEAGTSTDPQALSLPLPVTPVKNSSNPHGSVRANMDVHKFSDKLILKTLSEIPRAEFYALGFGLWALGVRMHVCTNLTVCMCPRT